VICLGGNTLDYVNIKSREGIRIAGSGDFRINNSRIEVNGSGSDHADGIQTYSPGDRGRIIVRNSILKCGLEAATAGLFIADNWTGNIGSEDYTLDLENVVFHGGPFGLRAHSDSNGDVRIALKDVFFVGPFKYKPFLLSGENGTQLRIMKWENVRTATISADGKLVPGSLIARP
jgi:hypothetical protein